MSCQDCEAQIGDYVDGTLDETQRSSVESHLATCASCRALAADFNEIRSTAGGKVKRIFAENGQLVRAHQPLLELEPI